MKMVMKQKISKVLDKIHRFNQHYRIVSYGYASEIRNELIDRIMETGKRVSKELKW